MSIEEITHASALELIGAVRGRKLKAARIVRAFLDRADRLEPSLNTYVTRTDDLALAAAHEVDTKIAQGHDPGPLAGLPISIKDLIAVGGVRQTFGSRLFSENVAATDAPSVARLRAAGACITGKTTTSELGSKAVGDSPLTGMTRNPWNPAHTPGGSSAGAAAGVAAGLVPAALGTDGGGSIRIPASFCGLVGVKAQFARVPVWPPSATPNLGHVAPMARTLDDAVLLLRIISGHDARDPSSIDRTIPEYGAALRQGVRGLRVGWSPDFGYGHTDPGVLDACQAALAPLAAAGASIVLLGALFDSDPASAWNAEFYSAIAARLAMQGEAQYVAARIDPALLAMAQSARSISSADRAAAIASRERIRDRVEAVFRRVDVLASPTMPVTAPPVGVNVPQGHEGRSPVDWSYFTYPFNLTGNPAMSMPVGLDARGLPIGLQLVGPARGEVLMLRVAAALTRFDTRPPLS